METKSQERTQIKSQELGENRQYLINTQVDVIEEQPSLLFGDDHREESSQEVDDSNSTLSPTRLYSPLRPGMSLVGNRPVPWNEVKRASLSFNGISQSPIKFSSPERLFEGSTTFVDEKESPEKGTNQIQDTQRINENLVGDTQQINNGLDDTQRVQNTIDDTQRIQHVLDDTQRIIGGDILDDTQKINEETFDHDNQSTSPPFNDTQVIALDPQEALSPTKVKEVSFDIQKSILEKETMERGHTDADTQVINERDTQVINERDNHNISTADTQIIDETDDIQIMNTDTQTINTADTQVINTADTQVINTNSQVTREPLGDTQIINKASQSLEINSDIPPYDPFTMADTQVINPLLQKPLTSPVVSSPELHRNYQFSPILQRLQIPNTEARSRTQVINTQEDDMADDTFLRHESDRRSVRSRHFDDTEDIEIKSDEEDKDMEIDNVLVFDDSIPNHKRRLTSSDVEEEPSKVARIESGIDQLAGLTSFEKSSPPSSDKRGSKVSQYKTEYDRKRLPSSPTKDQVSSEITDLSQSVGDMKFDKLTSEIGEKIEDKGKEEEEHIKVGKNRTNFVAPSQSQAESSKIISQPPTILREEILEILTENQIVNKTGVFALYTFKFYPGIITEYCDGDSLTVIFNEGDYKIKNTDLYVLDIRVGDKVRLKSQEYNVTGLSFEENSGDITCIRGFNHVYLLKSKANKRSKEISVPLSECYMELSDFFQHQLVNQIIYDGVDILKKNYSFFIEKSNNKTEVKSEVQEKILEASPRKQSRNNTVPIIGSGTRLSPKRNITVDRSGKAFSGSLFFMTSIEDGKKEELKKLITENGGVLIDEEIKDIFYYTTVDDKKILQLNMIEGFTFTAILSSGYCRSAKYFQALALGWPIISSQWIEDVVKHHSKITNWPVYLLPAGQSAHLGTIKSLDVHKFRTNMENNEALIKDQLTNNAELLQDYNILMAYNRNNNTTLETCEFIFHAFGVNSLQIFNNFGEIKKYLATNKHLSNLLVYTNSEDDTKKLGKKTPTLSRSNSLLQKLVDAKDDRIGLINWEWVVQCVISQYVWEPEAYITM